MVAGWLLSVHLVKTRWVFTRHLQGGGKVLEGVRVLGIRVTVKLGIWVSRTQLETRPLFPTSKPVLWFHVDTELQGNITYPSGLAPHSVLLSFQGWVIVIQSVPCQRICLLRHQQGTDTEHCWGFSVKVSSALLAI